MFRLRVTMPWQGQIVWRRLQLWILLLVIQPPGQTSVAEMQTRGEPGDVQLERGPAKHFFSGSEDFSRSFPLAAGRHLRMADACRNATASRCLTGLARRHPSVWVLLFSPNGYSIPGASYMRPGPVLSGQRRQGPQTRLVMCAATAKIAIDCALQTKGLCSFTRPRHGAHSLRSRGIRVLEISLRRASHLA